MKLLWVAACLPAIASAAGDAASSLSRAFQGAGFDSQACYRVRDVSFQKDDLRFYLTDGRLIFSKPVAGRRFAALFTTDVDGGDGEVILFPPHRSERLSLASFTKTPNLNEHLRSILFLFTDGTGEELMKKMESAKPEPEAGLLMEQSLSSTLKNIVASYETRLVEDFLSPGRQDLGMFYGIALGRDLGSFDLIYDPRGREQILIGQVTHRENRQFFDTWASFQSRPFRTGQRPHQPRTPLNITDVSIDATIADDLTLRATTKIAFTVPQQTGQAIAFDLSRRMRVTEAKVNGEPAEVFVREAMRANLLRGVSDNDVFLVVLGAPLEPGKTHTVEFRHEGNVILQAGNGVFFVGARNSWYPSRDGAFAKFDLTFRHPKAFDLVATGTLMEERVEGESKITRRRTTSPVRFAGFNIGKYEKVSVTKAGFQIDVFANHTVEAALVPKPPEVVLSTRTGPGSRTPSRAPDLSAVAAPAARPNPKARLMDVASEITAAMEFLSSHLGPPPLETLTVAPIPGAFGQGFAGLIYLSTLSYIPAEQRPGALGSAVQDTFFSELLPAHEAAHQWFGNLITSDSYQDDWIMESLANYTSLMLLEKRRGKKALETVLAQYRDQLVQETEEGKMVDSAGPIIWGPRLNTSHGAAARPILYGKGSWIIHMLRVRLGDAQFLKMLGELVKRYRYRAVTTEDLRKVAAEFTLKAPDDSTLEGFFESWVYGTGIPTLSLTHRVQGKGAAARVHATLTQSGVSEEFSALVPVEIQVPGKPAVTRWVKSTNEPVTFSMAVSRAPVKVTLDPAKGVLSQRK